MNSAELMNGIAAGMAVAWLLQSLTEINDWGMAAIILFLSVPLATELLTNQL